VAEDTTLQDAIRNLNESSLQIALVVSPDGRLLGTLTDGDIRRGLLSGMHLASVIGPIIYREPLVVPPQVDRGTVLQLMQANKLHQVPVVDEQRRLIGLHLWDDFMVPTVRANCMAIMAGGRGDRLRPHTEHCPKPMLPVSGKPMLEHIVERAKGEGFRRFVFAIHYLGHMIEEYFGDGSRWEVDIEYVREQSPLGTVGAISLLASRPDAPIVVSNGDVLTDIRYGELLDFHVRHSAVATMAVRLHEWVHPFGVVLTNGVDIVGFEEKPVSRSHINAGIYVLSPVALDSLTLGEHCDMPLLFSRLKSVGARTIVYPMHEPWLDVGREEDLRRANSHS
jgi:dTDP-glucose pyrophosphorylase